MHMQIGTIPQILCPDVSYLAGRHPPLPPYHGRVFSCGREVSGTRRGPLGRTASWQRVVSLCWPSF